MLFGFLGMMRSMNRKRDNYDNAAIETFHTCNTELSGLFTAQEVRPQQGLFLDGNVLHLQTPYVTLSILREMLKEFEGKQSVKRVAETSEERNGAYLYCTANYSVYKTSYER